MKHCEATELTGRNAAKKRSAGSPKGICGIAKRNLRDPQQEIGGIAKKEKNTSCTYDISCNNKHARCILNCNRKNSWHKRTALSEESVEVPYGDLGGHT